jgi:hypothetical protein
MGTGAISRGKAFGASRNESVPMFRMSETVLCSPSFAVMVWTETTLPFFVLVFSLNCIQYFKYVNFIFAPKKYTLYFAEVFA